LTHPVRFISAARAELERAQDWYEAQRPGLGTQFVERVDEAVAKIAKHPEAYQQIINDVRRAAIPRFPYALWFRIEPDFSIVIACLHKRRETTRAIRQALKRLDP
jgi:plasmid stabilization system protein ParE